MMKKSALLCCGMSAGAALMYLYDPQSGRRRRGLMRDKLLHGKRLLREGAASTGRDVTNRATGIWASFLSLFAEETEVPDQVIESRVRSRLGRVVTHPAWIQVQADHGRLKVAGHVPSREKDRLHRTVTSIRGVDQVDEDDLVIDPDDQVPDTGRKAGSWMAGPWSPAERAGTGLIGAILGTYGMRRGGFTGGLAALAGLGLCLCGITDRKFFRSGREAGVS
jgi:hypothetical protein